MNYKIYNKIPIFSVSSIIIALNTVIFLSLTGCTSYIRPGAVYSNVLQIPVVERSYSDDPGRISIGIANKMNRVSLSGTESIRENKNKILRIIDLLKKHNVNMILFPEFSLTGYFWDDSPGCWNYMREGLTNNHLEWLDEIKSKLDEHLQYVIFNNIRLDPDDPDGKFLNSTYVVDKNFNCTNLNSESNEQFHIYDKTFLPGIEKTFTKSGEKDILVLGTQWGKFGLTTCYDMCFTQIFQEYAMFDKVDAVVQLASWRGTSEREYPGMNAKTDHYYGFVWDLMASSQAAFNQIWVIACNAVGTQKRGNYEFWGGSSLWAPSGIKLFQGSNDSEELIVIHNIDIKGQIKYERDDFNYYYDFLTIYDLIGKNRSFTRIKN
ncbi:MAG: carbon-nitrogen hydrolase family protein [Deltaproteobacteria bacterium]|nr:carbon-nitrogen hydrolase family protein [Deltaproteobacteria bacterium]